MLKNWAMFRRGQHGPFLVQETNLLRSSKRKLRYMHWFLHPGIRNALM